MTEKSKGAMMQQHGDKGAEAPHHMTIVKMRTKDEQSLVFDPSNMNVHRNFTNEEGERLLQEAMGKIHEMMADCPNKAIALHISPDPMFDTYLRR